MIIIHSPIVYYSISYQYLPSFDAAYVMKNVNNKQTIPASMRCIQLRCRRLSNNPSHRSYQIHMRNLMFSCKRAYVNDGSRLGSSTQIKISTISSAATITLHYVTIRRTSLQKVYAADHHLTLRRTSLDQTVYAADITCVQVSDNSLSCFM